MPKIKRCDSVSKIAVLIIGLAVVVSLVSERHWKSNNRVIAWDVVSYYVYLPATFIYHDLSLEFIDNYQGPHEFEIWAKAAENGKKLSKMSMGLAFLYLPFFWVGHVFALLTSYDAGGYSEPYRFVLQLSSLFYLLIGLFYLRKMLVRYFSEKVAALSLLLIFFATNLFYYSTHEATMSHSYSFSLFSMFIWLTIKWYEKVSVKNSLLLGLIGGLIVLVRPTNIVVLLFFMLWDIKNTQEFKARISLYHQKISYLMLVFLAAFFVWVPQLIYWKVQTGSFLYFSYQDEGFFWGNPKIIEGLFSYRKGWLLYSPVMSFALIGIFFLRKTLAAFFLPVLVFTPVNIYVILSWWCWWYGGSFGLRTFIDSYAILIFPLAAVLAYVLDKKEKWLTQTTVVFSLLLIFHGLFQTQQYYNGAIHWNSMSKASYWDSFGRLHPSKKFKSLLVAPDYKAAMKGDR